MTDPDAELVARLRRMGPVWLGDQAAERLEEMRNALIQIDRLINMNRIWGGMGWKYLQAPSYRVEKIATLCREALDSEEPTDAS